MVAETYAISNEYHTGRLTLCSILGITEPCGVVLGPTPRETPGLLVGHNARWTIGRTHGDE